MIKLEVEVMPRKAAGADPLYLVVAPGEPNGGYRGEAFDMETARVFAASYEMLDALYTVLPYVEMAEKDESYKAGTVAKVTAQIRTVIAKAEGKA